MKVDEGIERINGDGKNTIRFKKENKSCLVLKKQKLVLMSSNGIELRLSVNCENICKKDVEILI